MDPHPEPNFRKSGGARGVRRAVAGGRLSKIADSRPHFADLPGRGWSKFWGKSSVDFSDSGILKRLSRRNFVGGVNEEKSFMNPHQEPHCRIGDGRLDDVRRSRIVDRENVKRLPW